MKKEKIDKAYTSNDYETCCFCSNNREKFVIDGNELTAEYIWTLNQEQREELIDKIIKKIRVDGFPYKQLLKHIYEDDQYISNQLQKLKKANPEKVMKDGFLSNSGSLCFRFCCAGRADAEHCVFAVEVPEAGAASGRTAFGKEEAKKWKQKR